ncbi:alpha/beta hydrolase family protein [Spirosoma validum]|nr:alpha/beta fold hydrolase [Spirosoma validum]
MDTWGTIKFSQNEQKLWQAILNTKVNAHRSSHFPTTTYPTIIYNHGGGGTANENAVLFEFLASHGFVVISCNYKYPADNEQGFEYYFASKKFTYCTDIEFVIQYSKQLPFTDPNRFYYIGHSFGAQQGLKLNQKGNRDIKRYILLDTTLEDYSLEAVTQMWPELDTLIQRHAKEFKTSTYIITAPRAYYENGNYLQQPYPEFKIYKFLSAERVTLVNSKQPMNHNSFLSLGIIKKFYAHEYPQIDNRTATGQVAAYFDVVRLVLSILTDKKLNRDKFIIVK